MTETTHIAVWFILQVITWGFILDAALSRNLIDQHLGFRQALEAIRPATWGKGRERKP